jgi:hypothetical protein
MEPSRAKSGEGTVTREHGIELYPDEMHDKRTEVWGEHLFGLLGVRFHGKSVVSRCVIVLDAMLHLQDTFHRVGILAPMPGLDVGGWFDDALERTITIL